MSTTKTKSELFQIVKSKGFKNLARLSKTQLEAIVRGESIESIKRLYRTNLKVPNIPDQILESNVKLTGNYLIDYFTPFRNIESAKLAKLKIGDKHLYRLHLDSKTPLSFEMREIIKRDIMENIALYLLEQHEQHVPHQPWLQCVEAPLDGLHQAWGGQHQQRRVCVQEGQGCMGGQVAVCLVALTQA